MANVLTAATCPNCGNNVDIYSRQEHLKCAACDTSFMLRGHLCAGCGKYHEEQTSFCGGCGDSLSRKCRRCQIQNWSGDEHCRQCGSAMDLLDAAALEHKRLAQQHRARQQEMMRESRESQSQLLDDLRDQLEQQDDELQAAREVQEQQQETTMLQARLVGLIVTGIIFVSTLLASVVYLNKNSGDASKSEASAAEGLSQPDLEVSR